MSVIRGGSVPTLGELAKMYQKQFKLPDPETLSDAGHDIRHSFFGVLPTPEGEVLIGALYKWCDKGEMTLKKAIEVFRDSEVSEQRDLRTRKLQLLTDKEIEHYTTYFNGLTKLQLEQYGEVDWFNNNGTMNNLPSLTTLPEDTFTKTGTTTSTQDKIRALLKKEGL